MAVSEAALRENYRHLPADKLLRLATDDAARLRPEALALLRAELGRRGLGETAEKAIAARLRVLTEAEIADYCALLQAQPCPRCWSLVQPLNATISSKVLSFVVMTTREKRFAIACPSCLDKLNGDATITSALLGWWGVPWGIIHTVRAIAFNSNMRKSNHLIQPNDLLKAFVVQNVGRIEAARDNPVDLQVLLKAASLA